MTTPAFALFDAYQTRIFVLVDGLTHVQRYRHIPINFSEAAGQPADQYEVQQRDFNVTAWDAAVENFLTNWVGQFNTDCTFFSAELWKYAAGSNDAIFLSAFAPTTQPTSGGTYTPAAESIFTARTALGHIVRFIEIEGRATGSAIIPWVADNAGNSTEKLAYDVTVASDSTIVDREGGFPISALRISNGQNEAVWRKRFRS